MLDYDGTLAPFVADRDVAHPWPGVAARIDALLEEHEGQGEGSDGERSDELIIVTGRPARDVPALLGTTRRPTIWGSHGRELWRQDGSYEMTGISEANEAGLAKAKGWLAGRARPSQVEEKPAGLAVHWRGLDRAEAAALETDARGIWAPLAAEHALDLHGFDGGLELRCPGRTKAHAVRAVLDEVPGSPGAQAGSQLALAYLGDDRTDEDAFAELRDARRSDSASSRAPRSLLGLLVRAEPRESLADERITPPQELLDFLDRWREARRRTHERAK